MQQQNKSFYSLDTPIKRLSHSIQKKYYNCHRSYSYKPKGSQKRALKSTGTNKIGKACPSRMEVSFEGQEETKLIKVKFWKPHCGHLLELGHMVLSKWTRTEIAGRDYWVLVNIIHSNFILLGKKCLLSYRIFF